VRRRAKRDAALDLTWETGIQSAAKAGALQINGFAASQFVMYHRFKPNKVSA
jgi:hypothetical protein